MKNLIIILAIFLLPLHLYSTKKVFKAKTDLLLLGNKMYPEKHPYKFPYIVNFKLNNKELHIVATNHTSNFNSDAFKTIEKEIKNFKPEIIIVEKSDSSMGISPKAFKELYRSKAKIKGEGDYSIHLAIKNKIDFFCAEPTTKFLLETIPNFKIIKRNINEKDVFLFYIIRSLSNLSRRDKINSEDDLHNYLFKNVAEEKAKQYNFNKNLTEIKYSEFKIWYKELTRTSFDWHRISYSPTRPDDLGLLNSYISYVRDINITTNVANLLNTYNKILLVYGGGHYPRFDTVFIEMFEGKPTFKKY